MTLGDGPKMLPIGVKTCFSLEGKKRNQDRENNINC